MSARDEAVRNWLRAGVSRSEIARRLGIDRSTVGRVAARVGFPSRPRNPDSRNWPAIREFYELGNSAAACMRCFGISASTWDAAVKRGEIVPRHRTSQRPRGERRQQVAGLLGAGLGVAEIARRLGVSTPTVCYHARRLGVPPQGKFARRHDWDLISRVYDAGVPMRECKRRFGFSSDAWADAVARGDVVPRSRLIPLEELLVAGRPQTSRGHVKSRLLREGRKDNRCEECGLDEWRGRLLSMQLHHRNGDGSDNRIENLAMLCANCHSQTDTYGGRNGQRARGPRLTLVGAPGKLAQKGEEAAQARRPPM